MRRSDIVASIIGHGIQRVKHYFRFLASKKITLMIQTELQHKMKPQRDGN